MNSNEIRERFLKFFEQKSHGGHKIIPSASLVPEVDMSSSNASLFTTAGMQQFKLYYTGAKDAMTDFGTLNTVSIQKCVRTSDIDEVGDDTHLTFFEMLGNFSFGGYWKKEAIEYAHEFITKELNLEIDYVSVFEGDKDIPADDKSREIWKNIDPKLEIKNHNRVDNFWGPTGDEGPCGPTTEIYINGVEIWNIVFNEFYKTKEGKYEPLKVKGIDTGMGLERLLVQVQKKNNVYETDLFNNEQTKEERIIADHIRTAVFMIADGVIPSNKEAGYVVRKLLRTVASNIKVSFEKIVNVYIQKYSNVYPNLNSKQTIHFFNQENDAYIASRTATGKALTEKEKTGKPLTGYEAFGISSTLGARVSDVLEIAEDLGVSPSPEFKEELEKASLQHKNLSRTASAGMFKGGLVNHEPKTIKLHTAHHLLLAALQDIVGAQVKQRGSNITEERLRIDFLCDHKLTDEEKKKVEEWVNDNIARKLNVVRREMPLAEAHKIGAEMEFGAKYADIVSVYFIVPMPEASRIRDGEAIGKDILANAVSKEFCGGPHVSNTSELGHFKIQKEEAVAQGIRRIKAVLL